MKRTELENLLKSITPENVERTADVYGQILEENDRLETALEVEQNNLAQVRQSYISRFLSGDNVSRETPESENDNVSRETPISFSDLFKEV